MKKKMVEYDELKKELKKIRVIKIWLIIKSEKKISIF